MKDWFRALVGIMGVALALFGFGYGIYIQWLPLPENSVRAFVEWQHFMAYPMEHVYSTLAFFGGIILAFIGFYDQ